MCVCDMGHSTAQHNTCLERWIPSLRTACPNIRSGAPLLLPPDAAGLGGSSRALERVPMDQLLLWLKAG